MTLQEKEKMRAEFALKILTTVLGGDDVDIRAFFQTRMTLAANEMIAANAVKVADALMKELGVE